MPLNVRSLIASAAFAAAGLTAAAAQNNPPPINGSINNPVNAAPPTAVVVPAVSAPSAGDVMRTRVSKAKAFIAVRNYNAAIYELENIRRETNDSAVNGVVNVLLMNSYLEQGDYKRAQDFLGEFYKAQTANKPNAAVNYLTVAAQIVKGGRNQLERYRALGLSVSDRNLPLEAAVDIQKMRDTLELVIEQSKVIGKDQKQTAGAMALLEEATNTRGSLAKDDYDVKRWKDEVGDAREELANSRSVIVNADGGAPTTNSVPVNPLTTVAANVGQSNVEAAKTSEQTLIFKPVAAENQGLPPVKIAAPPENKNSNGETAKNDIAAEKNAEPNNSDDANKPPKTASRTRTVENVPADENSQTANNAADAPKNTSPLNVGSLVTYATKKQNPSYPLAAKTMRTTGIVTVAVVVDEAGEVSEIQKTDGPAILQSAAKDAVKKWKFKPFVRDGQPVKATGFVSFNFNL